MAEAEDDLACVLCGEGFQLPHRAPLLLPCTHSACRECLRRAEGQHESHVVCPVDLEASRVEAVRNDTATRRLLQRVAQEHQSYNSNSQLLRIQALSRHFEGAARHSDQARTHFQSLVETIIAAEVQRLQSLRALVVQDLTHPLKAVEEWKGEVRSYLTSLKQDGEIDSSLVSRELGHFVSEGRKIKREVGCFMENDFEEMASRLAACPQACLAPGFALSDLCQKESSGKVLKEVTCQRVNSIPNQAGREQTPQLSRKTLKAPLAAHHPSKPSCNSLNPNQLDYDHSSSHFNCFLGPQPAHAARTGTMLSSKTPSAEQLLAYSPSPSPRAEQRLQTEELLLNEEAAPRRNFMREWGVTVEQARRETEVEARLAFDWNRESNNYIRKVERMQAHEAQAATRRQQGCLELINYSLQGVDLRLYFDGLSLEGVGVVKLVRTGLTDPQLNELLNALVGHSVSTLVLSGNCLSEAALDGLLHFCQANPHMRSVYLSRNGISCLRGQARQKVALLKEGGITLYI